jgi:GTP-binding protein
VLDPSTDENFDLDDDVFEFSGLTGEGVDDLMYRIADVVATVELSTPERDGFVLHRPLRDDFTVRRDGPEWVVEGIAAVRAVNLSDLTDPDAAQFVSARLERSGIVDGLREAGAVSGDDVRIGSIVFTFDPDLDTDTDFEI